MIPDVHYCFIVNPVSGKGSALDTWEKVKVQLDRLEIAYSLYVSKYHKHTLEIVTDQVRKGRRYFIGVGGDGTINEIVNGIYKSRDIDLNEFVIGLLPVGTGNDWVRSLPGSMTIKNICDKLVNPTFLDHMVGIISHGESQHFFINVSGMGLDGEVVHELETQSEKNGKLAYLKSALKALLSFKTPLVLEESSQGSWSGKLLFFTCSIGRYFGGGMLISPGELVVNQLKFTRVKKESFLKILPQLPKLYNGKVNEIPFVDQFQSKEVKVKSSNSFHVQADGEYVGKFNVVAFSVHENLIKVIC